MKTGQQEIICNCCKKVIQGQKAPYAEFLHVQKQWGYFSNKDGEKQEFDVCEACYDKWLESFQIPAKKTEVTEYV